MQQNRPAVPPAAVALTALHIIAGLALIAFLAYQIVALFLHMPGPMIAFALICAGVAIVEAHEKKLDEAEAAKAAPQYFPPTLREGADLTEFPTREAALEFLDGAWLHEVYGPQHLAGDLDVRIVAANLADAERRGVEFP